MRETQIQNQRPLTMRHYCFGIVLLYGAVAGFVLWRAAHAELGDLDPEFDKAFNMMGATLLAMALGASLLISLAVAATLYLWSPLHVWWVCGLSVVAGPAALCLYRAAM